MKNQSNTHMSTAKKVILGILAIPGLFILYILGTIALTPLFDSIDKGKFEKLDTDSQAIYEKVLAASAGAEDWSYTANCTDILAGMWSTGQFRCETTIRAQTYATNVGQLNAMHDKYFPIIDSSRELKATTALDKHFADDFEIKFVVSGAEKQYTTTDNSVFCRYLADLAQPEEPNTTIYDQDYGSPIATGTGRVIVSLVCSGKARDNWYGNS